MSTKISAKEIAARKAQSNRDKQLAAAAAAAASRANTNQKPVIGGKGDYKLKSIGGIPIGRAVGTAIGSYFGHPTVGGAVGHAAHWAANKLWGWGDYSEAPNMTPKERALKFRDQHVQHLQPGRSLLVGGHLPLMKTPPGEKWTILTFEEMVGSVLSSVNFTNTSYRVNPGQSRTFPYMSGVARNMGQYKLLGMVFHAKSLVSDNSQSGLTVGEWGLSTRYSSSRPAPESMPDFSLGQFAQIDAATKPVVGIVECDPSRLEGTPWKDVLNDGQSNSLNQDHCTLDVGVQGFPTAGLRIGELWVTYHVAFNMPCLNLSAAARTATFDTGVIVNGGSVVAMGMPAGQTPIAGSTLQCSFLGVSQLMLGKIPGVYQIAIHWTSSANLSGGTGNILGADSTGVNWTSIFAGGAPVATWSGSTIGGNAALAINVIKCTGATPGLIPDFTIGCPNVAANASYRMVVNVSCRENTFSLNAATLAHVDLMETLYKTGVLKRPTGFIEVTHEDLICRYTYDGPNVSVEVWPYNGPIPPDDDYIVDEATLVSQMREQQLTSARESPGMANESSFAAAAAALIKRSGFSPSPVSSPRSSH